MSSQLSKENSESKCETPWGAWEVLDDSPHFKVKKITVKPKHRLSYQKHSKREEFWYVVEGIAEVTLDDKLHQLRAGESIHIPIAAAHRVKCISEDTNLVLIEIQRGSYFGEDDIVRLSDDYGRAK